MRSSRHRARSVPLDPVVRWKSRTKTRPEAAAVVEELRRNGVSRVAMLSGDNRETAALIEGVREFLFRGESGADGRPES